MGDASVNIKRSLFAITGLLLTSGAAQAMVVTANLAQSAENFVEYGLGPNADNLGTFAFDQGACAFDGTNTTCTLSGDFTGSTPPFTSGTYALVTKYAGNDRTTALVGTSIAGNPDFFGYTSASPSTSITLNLFSAGRTLVQPVVAGGRYVPAITSFAFSSVPPYTCSGTPVVPCRPAVVGLTNGAIGQSPVTTVVSFDNSCVGDCDGNGDVTVNELITLVNIALGYAPPSACPNGVPSGRQVNIALIVQAVNNALYGCGA